MKIDLKWHHLLENSHEVKEKLIEEGESSFFTKSTSLPSITIIGSPVTALPFESQIEVILQWARDRLSKNGLCG